jgi:Cu+-exporting ATPase
MDVLVSLGTNSAYTYSIISIVHRRQQYTRTGRDVGGSDFFETAALLVTFISLGKYLEAHAKGKTSEARLRLLSKYFPP